MHIKIIIVSLLAGQGILAAPAPTQQNQEPSSPFDTLRTGVNGIGSLLQRLTRSASWHRPAAYEVYNPASAYSQSGSRRLTKPKNKVHLDSIPGNSTASINGTGTGLPLTIPSTGTILTTFPTPSSPGGTGTIPTPVNNITSAASSVLSITGPQSIPLPANSSLPVSQNLTTPTIPISVSQTVITIFSDHPSTLTVTGIGPRPTPTSTSTVWVTAAPAILTQPTSTFTIFVTAQLVTVTPNPSPITLTVTAPAVTLTTSAPVAPAPVWTSPWTGAWTGPWTGTPAPQVVGHTVTLRETQTLWSGVTTATSLVVIPDSITDITSSPPWNTGTPAPMPWTTTGWTGTWSTSSGQVFVTLPAPPPVMVTVFAGTTTVTV